MQKFRLRIALLLLVLIISFGTFSYTLIEKTAPFDAFYIYEHSIRVCFTSRLTSAKS